jgi:plasmid stabilization system protein ParE
LIRLYIAADSREAAGRLAARIEREATRIAASPHVGGMTGKAGFLRFPIGKYLMVYEIVNDEVVFLYVQHSARPRPWEGE